MKDKKTFFVYLITALTVLLNCLMLFITRSGNEDIFSNIFVIIIALFCLKIYIIAIKTNQTSKMRPEFYGILFLFGISAMRFLNRIIQISDVVNYSSIIVFLGVGTFFLFIAIGRIASNKKNRK
ncbi:hypothetical protein [Clostridium estertheticum]|uniref:hypothetical protein n=1 Tax=Clostridium estertheticum TaxID=238834 RepID=UPI001C6E418D|nr:hypothetical protein [Clostridium estertheticum]MBW9153740.1 hypothetical protein [Clostridium estertheticum]WLC85875.1 hypothetical protein KTC97_09080 [Clostridium estertheticum]